MSNELIITKADAINQSLEAPEIDPVLLQIANDYLAGAGIADLSQKYGISEDRINAVITKKEIKSYIDNVYLTQGYMNRIKRMQLINRVIMQKEEEALESGVYSKKDLLEWLKLLNSMEEQVRGKEKGPQVAVQINNNYESLMRDLFKEDK